jgi:hypothetical protein
MKTKHLGMGQAMKKIKQEMAKVDAKDPKFKQLDQKWLEMMENAANFGVEVAAWDENLAEADKYSKLLAKNQLPKSSWVTFERAMWTADTINSLYSAAVGLTGLCK